MAWRLLIVVCLLGAGFTGCIGSSDPVEQTAVDPSTDDRLEPTADQALFDDPQHFPHPAFGGPTLTHVPEDAPRWWQPIEPREVPEEITGLEPIGGAGEGGTGDGIAVFGSLVINPSGEVFNISNPEDPQILTELDLEIGARQVVTIPFSDGRLFAAFATASGLIPVWNITDPTDPERTTVIEVPNNGHTIANVPGTQLLYNANAAGSLPAFPFAPTSSSGPVTEIYDLSDPREPELVQTWENGYGCHMVSFHITTEHQRAYCAAVDATQIWDISDPAHPEVVSTTPMPHGVEPAPGEPILATVSHWAVVNRDATVMAVADETGGGAAPMCDAKTSVGDRTVSGPWGNVWFYDITDEEEPELVGWISPSSHVTYEPRPGSCTAHIGRMVPHASQDLLAMSFYAGGLAVIDFTDPSNPSFVAHWTGEDPMDAWFYNGYIVSGDASSGIDVLTLEG